MWQFDLGLNSLETVTIVSTASVTVLLASAPSLFVLPIELEKAPDATERKASVLLSGFGVNVAEKKLPEPEKLERVPPETVTSASEKSVEDSERVKAIVVESPVPKKSSESS